MARLALLPPYTLDDVRHAYRAKVRHVHRDAGGSRETFEKLTDAYERAVEYVEFRGSRRTWLAEHVERYCEQEALISRLESRGGIFEIQKSEWRVKSFGDFA